MRRSWNVFSFSDTPFRRMLLCALACLPLTAQAAFAPTVRAAAEGSQSISLARGRVGYIVVEGGQDREAHQYVDQLAGYMSAVLKKPTRIVTAVADVPDGAPVLLLQRGFTGLPQGITVPAAARADDEDFALAGERSGSHQALLVATASANGIRRAMQKLIIDSEQTPSTLVLRFAPGFYSPWIEQREDEPVTWSPTLVRGKFTNAAVDPRLFYQHWSDAELDRYFAMLDMFGYSGIRIEEGAWAYAVFGSIEADHRFVERVAEAVKKNHMERTLAVLYDDFNSYGWVDPSVVYQPAPGYTASTDPAVQATFNKYFDEYADLVPYVDRIGGQLADPGHLTRVPDLIHYVDLMISKARARKPQIPADVVFWATDPEQERDFVRQLPASGLKNVSVLLTNFPPKWNTENMQKLHAMLKQEHLPAGYWSWYVADMETDQHPSMYVNSLVLKWQFDRILREVDWVDHPTYWSTMDGYHPLDLFSLYVSAQLQWNPHQDPHRLLKQVATGIWGPVNGRKMYHILRFVEDVRSGSTFDEYWLRALKGTLGSNDPARDLRRARAALAALQTLEPDAGFVRKFPLPCSPQDLTSLMVPQMKQIADLATFRIGLAKVRAAAAAGASKSELTQRMEAIWHPVPEYSTLVGTGSTIELEDQEQLIHDFEWQYGVRIPDPASMISRDADRIVESLRRRQSYSALPLLWQMDPNRMASSWGSDQLIDRDFFYLQPMLTHRDAWRDRVALMLKRGEIKEVYTPTGLLRYRLAHWRKWALKSDRPHPASPQ